MLFWKCDTFAKHTDRSLPRLCQGTQLPCAVINQPDSGSVLPGFVLELCWDIAGLSQSALVSSMGTGGIRGDGQRVVELVQVECVHRVGWGLRHLTSQRDMRTEGSRIPECEPFWGETQEQVLALQKYQADDLKVRKAIYQEIQLPCPKHLPSFFFHTSLSSTNSPLICSGPQKHSWNRFHLPPKLLTWWTLLLSSVGSALLLTISSSKPPQPHCCVAPGDMAGNRGGRDVKTFEYSECLGFFSVAPPLWSITLTHNPATHCRTAPAVLLHLSPSCRTWQWSAVPNEEEDSTSFRSWSAALFLSSLFQELLILSNGNTCKHFLQKWEKVRMEYSLISALILSWKCNLVSGVSWANGHTCIIPDWSEVSCKLLCKLRPVTQT